MGFFKRPIEPVRGVGSTAVRGVLKLEEFGTSARQRAIKRKRGVGLLQLLIFSLNCL